MPPNFGNTVPLAQVVLPVDGVARFDVYAETTDGRIWGYSSSTSVPPLGPSVHDAILGDRPQGSMISHSFTTDGGDLPITWSDLLVSGPGVPAIAPTLTADGMFNWDTVGSPLGMYNFDVTAINAVGNDVGRLSVNLVRYPPVVFDLTTNVLPGDIVMYTFTAIDLDTPGSSLTWSEFAFEGENVAIQPTFDPLIQLFSWNTVGSPRGLYTARVTVSDPHGESDRGTLQIFIVPEPTTMTLIVLVMFGLRGLAIRKRTRAIE
jgi:hypothetical protein